MKLNALYQFNDKYAPFAGVSMTSLFENNRDFDEIRVYILGENISENNEQLLRTTTINYGRIIEFIDTSKLIDKMKMLGMPTYRGSYAANMRLFLPEVLDAEIDRLLYLDADTIVNASLESLVKLNIKECPIAMALDSLGACHKKDLGIQERDYYYNSGVILFQMKKWRDMKMTELIVDHMKNIRLHYPSPDQDLLNVVCRKHIFCLNARYNFQPIHLAFSLEDYYRNYGHIGYYSYEILKQEKENVVIYHFFRFIGEFPWNYNNSHPANDFFDKYLMISLWKNYRKEKANLKGAIRVEKILYSYLPKCIFIIIFKYAHRLFLNKANKSSLKAMIDKNM